jgi:arginase
MKINVIGVPLNLGCDRAGVERAPNHLRERGLMGVIRKNGHKAFDLGNLYVPPVSEADKFVRGNSMKYLDAIVEVNTNLAELVYDTLRGGAFPLVIGGDQVAPRAWVNVMMISVLSGWTLMGISIPARLLPVVISTGCL